MIKKLIGLAISALLLFLLVACNPSEGTKVDDTVWTNENAVYAYIKAGHETEILNDVEGAFSSLSFQKAYVTEKNINSWTPLAILFVLEESGAEKQQAFIEILNQDERINHARVSRDLPFETVDTRFIDKAKDAIAVGETLTLEAKGSIDFYVQPLEFEGFMIKPKTSKAYKVTDFPQVDIKSLETRDNGWLYLELTTAGYFEVIKAINALSRLSTIESVKPDRNLISIIPPIWEISDKSVADFVAGVEWGDYPKAIVKGLKAGKVTVDFGGVSCEITVI